MVGGGEHDRLFFSPCADERGGGWFDSIRFASLLPPSRIWKCFSPSCENGGNENRDPRTEEEYGGAKVKRRSGTAAVSLFGKGGIA
mmetsp:Transcript_28529/g.83976  ORF Transcript_28529/g.83976 Transcript_28529/m.83976 type:complete len:86 (+) Transcript_28529:1587-1844(+)